MEEKEINYSVYNTLNLMNNHLGELYLSTGYNPFGAKYILNKNMAIGLLEKQNMPTKKPEFIDNNNKSVKVNFETALKNTQELLLSENKLPSEIIILLKNRAELLKLFIQKLKNKESAYSLYCSLNSFDPGFCRIMEDSFYERWNQKNAIDAFKVLMSSRANLAKLKEEQLSRERDKLVKKIRARIKLDKKFEMQELEKLAEGELKALHEKLAQKGSEKAKTKAKISSETLLSAKTQTKTVEKAKIQTSPIKEN